MQDDNIYTDRKDTFNYLDDEEAGGILELIKTVHMTNNFVTALEIQKIFFPTNYLTVRGIKSAVKLPLFGKERIFELILRMPIPELNRTQFNTWLGLEAYGMIVPIHIKVYDKRLHCSMNIDGIEISEKCFDLKNVSLNFGYIAMNEVFFNTFLLTNPF